MGNTAALLRPLLRLAAGERGMALPMSLASLLAIGAVVMGTIEFTTANGRTANISRARVNASAVAEAGIATALAVLNNPANNPTTSTLLGCNAGGTTCTPFVSTFTGGTATWSGWLDSSGGSSRWRLTSVGQVANPTGGVALRATMTAQVPLVQQAGTPNASVWNYAFSTRPPGSGCEVDINGSNVIIDIPLYVTADLCLTGSNVAIDERGEGQNPAAQPIDLRVGGKLVYAGSNATVGTAGDYLTSGGVAEGCALSVAATPVPCARPLFNWYVSTIQPFEPLSPPVADYAAQSAAPHAITSTAATGGDCDVRSGTPPSINPDALLDGDAGTLNLTPGYPYTCRKAIDGTAAGEVVAELSWNGSTTLTVEGTIVVDGNLSLNDSNATYQGSASVYANGAVTMNGPNARLCANATCSFTSWNPNSEMLLLVGTSVFMNGSNNQFQGGLFCNPESTADFSGSNVVIQGPVICGRFTFGSNTVFKPLPAVTNLPVGAPVEPNVSVAPGTPVYGG
jgi:Tfp pilus assembly protein PilX